MTGALIHSPIRIFQFAAPASRFEPTDERIAIELALDQSCSYLSPPAHLDRNEKQPRNVLSSSGDDSCLNTTSFGTSFTITPELFTGAASRNGEATAEIKDLGPYDRTNDEARCSAIDNFACSFLDIDNNGGATCNENGTRASQ